MEPDVVPPDLATAVLRAGYRVGGPAGVGAHGPAWTAIGPGDDAAGGTRVVVTALAVPAGSRGDGRRSRLEVLRAVRHEHLAQIVDVLPVGGEAGDSTAAAAAERLVVLLAEVPGPNLGALLAARPPLAAGEVVTLAVPLAQALAALHGSGLVHGDVSPANVVVRPDGRPVLVDLLGAVTREAGSGPAGGTPGFAAPEVESGVALGPAADVYALARVALAALDRGSGPLRVVLEQACAPDPADRPSAAGLAAGCYGAAAALPLAVPDPAVLARTTLASLAAGPDPRSALTVTPSGSRHRATGGRWRRPGPVLAVGAVSAAVVAGVLVHGLAAGVGPGREVPPAVPSGPRPAVASSSRPSDPLAAAVALTERRPGALTAADPAALAAVDLMGSRAHAADLALRARLLGSGQRVEGLAVTVSSARLASPFDPGQAGPDPVTARVEVTSAPTAYRRVSPSGAVSAVPAQPARTVVLTVRWAPAGWRVAEVAPPVSDPRR